MPTTRLATTVTILSKLTALHRIVYFNARTRRNVGTASWEEKFIWVIDLEYQGGGDTKIETRGEGHTFDEALHAAWNKFSTVCMQGLGAGALAPPVEQKALANGAQEANDSPAF